MTEWYILYTEVHKISWSATKFQTLHFTSFISFCVKITFTEDLAAIATCIDEIISMLSTSLNKLDNWTSLWPSAANKMILGGTYGVGYSPLSAFRLHSIKWLD